MEHHHQRPPSLNLSPSAPARPVSTSPSPLHQQSQSPFRYVHFDQRLPEMNEKETPPADFTPASAPTPTAYRQSPPPLPSSNPAQSSRSSSGYYASSPFLRQPTPLHTRSQYSRPRSLLIANLVRPWLPVILYAFTSLAFVFAIALYRDDVFAREPFFWEIHSYQHSDVMFRSS